MSDLNVGASRVCITPDASLFPVEHFNNRMTGKTVCLQRKNQRGYFCTCACS